VNLNSFFNLGIIPKELENKVVIAGNTSLAGAIKAIYDSDYEVEVEKIKQISSELNLAENGNFNNYFAEYMFF
ncbi:MAG: ASKHA domain-containing protein, partial [Fusobacteriaceae bacterium]